MDTEDQRESNSPRDHRWDGHPLLAGALTFGVFVVPIAVSVASAILTGHLLPRPHGVASTLGWWVAVLGVPSIVLLVTDRLARKALPLAVLLKMTMVFPDQAPKRFAVARKAGTTRDLARRVEEAKAHGAVEEPIVAAEKILALAGALNAHDRLTRGHAERVRAYTDLIADELGLPATDRDRLRWSALLHDIGKLAVHPDILNKPDKLNDAEWEVIKNHPLEGAALTAPLAGWLGAWADTIAEHHERYDGAGYPHGLAGQQISLGGRIVAVADSYDTMTTVRTYKRPMTQEEARSELAACAGSQFDPKVVRAFLDVSIARLRPVAGPITWLGSLPFVGNLPRLGQIVAVAGRTGVAAAAVTGAVATGAVSASSPSVTPTPHGTYATRGPGTQATPASPSPVGAGGSQSASNSSTLSVGLGVHPTSKGPPSAGGIPAGPGSGAVGATPSTTPGADPAGPSNTSAATTTTTSSTAPPSGSSSLTIRDGGGQQGRPQLGDQIIITFGSPPSPTAFCSSWTAGSFPDLLTPNLKVQGTSGAGDDTVTLSGSGGCSGGFHFGSIDLGQKGYFNGSPTFGDGSQCTSTQTSGCTRVHWDGHETLTITLGQESTGQPTQNSPSVAVYTPDPALGVGGEIPSPSEVQF